MVTGNIDNDRIADTFDHIADLLEILDKNTFRIQSYRKAARSVRNTDESIAALVKEKGAEGLTDIAGIGLKLAGLIQEFVQTGRLGLVDKLESEISPERVFTRVPGIGEELARRIHEELGIESLEELEQAAHDGRLESLEGVGEKRVEGVINALAGMLSRSSSRRARRRQKRKETDVPSINLLLDIDEEYRTKAEKDTLKKIAPRRFNPEGEKWLPLMKTKRNGWSFTVLYSNTAKAHELGKTHDWVVVYFKKDNEEDQCTVVTAEHGELKGKRVVRGREAECKKHYATHS